MRKILTLVAMMALAGCGGGGGGATASQPIAPATFAPQGDLVTPVFTIIIPPASKNSDRGRKPNYVSTAVQSVVITLTSVDGNAGTASGIHPNPVKTDVNGSTCSAGCPVNGPPSPPGHVDAYSIVTYDGTGGGGNALDSGTASITPVAGQNNTVSVTLMGIPFSIAIAPLTTQTVDTAGQTQGLAVTVADHSGQTITGTYAQPVRITDPDTATYGAGPTKGTSLSGTHPGSGCTTTCVDLLTNADTATLTYNGLAEDPVTLTSSATGVSGGNAGSATFTPTLHAIAHTSGGNSASAGSPVGIDLFTNDSTSSIGYSGTEGYHEDGFTDSPYNKVLTTINGTACAFASLGAANVSNDTVFTATTTPAAPSAQPAAGTCTRVVSDGLAAASHGTGGPQFVVTYTTSGVSASSKHRHQ